MKRTLFLLLGVVALLASCDETTDTLGSSLTNKGDIINVTDNIFRITSRSIAVDSVLARGTRGYIGNVKDPETGAYVKTDFTTQFHISERFSFADEKKLAHGIEADSCDFRLFFESYYGDSLAAMKATVYELARPMEEGVNYYSSFDPEAHGMVRVGDGMVKSSKVFSLINTNISDSLRYSDDYTNNILFSLNAPYKAADGREYKNYGSYLMQRYYSNPADFKDAYTFTHNVCPGFYVKMENGVGAMAYIQTSQLAVYYTTHDTIDHKMFKVFAGTQEMRQVTRVQNDRNRLRQLAEDKTCTYIKSPAGIVTELTLPVEEIFKNHEKDSLNSARITLRCMNDRAEDKYMFPKPSTLLIIQKDKVKDFFEKKEVANYRTSFLATYSSTENGYVFGNIAQLVKSMHDAMPEDIFQRDAWKAQNPDWNRVVVIPVTAGYTTLQNQTILSSLSNDMSLSSTRLVGGEQSVGGEIEMKVIYSNFNK